MEWTIGLVAVAVVIVSIGIQDVCFYELSIIPVAARQDRLPDFFYLDLLIVAADQFSSLTDPDGHIHCSLYV